MTLDTKPSSQPSPGSPNAAPTLARSTNQMWTILRKEFREIFRDRRTLMSVIISPLVITPALFALMGTLISGQVEKAKTQSYEIGFVGAEAAPEIKQVKQAFEQAPNLHIRSVTVAEAEKEIKAHKMSAAIVFPPDTGSLLGTQRTVPIEILQDVGYDNSKSASGLLSAVLSKAGEALVAERMKAQGVPEEAVKPFDIKEKAIKEGGSAGNLVFSMMLPYILILSTISGGIYAAFDQVAGEKERGTLETLLVSPASRRDIVLGKFGAVVCVCLISSLLTIVGLVISFSSRSKAFAWLSQGGLHISPTAVGVILLVLLPLAVLMAGMLLAVSTFARNQKEAQTYLGPIMIAVLIPAMSSMFVSADAGKMIALVPMLNASIIIKQSLTGGFDPAFIGLALATSVAYAAFALMFAIRLFQKESVLIKA